MKLTLTFSNNKDGYIITCFFIMLVGWIVQSASEEIAIRGWLIPIIGNKYNPVFAIIVQAVVFGSIHLLNSNVTILSLLNLTLSGVFFALYLIYLENIWGVCGLHFAWNFGLGNIYGYSVSGLKSMGGTIFKTTQTGSDILTVGSFGPEGSLISSIMLLSGIVILILKIHKKLSITHDYREVHYGK